METVTQQPNPAPSDNLSEAGLARRLFERANASAAPVPATSPAPTPTGAEIQPAPEEEEAAPPVTPETAPTPEASPDAETPPTPETETPSDEPASPEEPAEETGEEEAIPADPKGKVKRIHELMHQRKLAREEAAALKAQNQQLTEAVQQMRSGQPANVRPVDRFSHHPQVKDLDARLSASMATLDWCDANPQGGEATVAPGQTYNFTAEEVSKMRRQADNDRVDLRTERAQRVGDLLKTEETQRKAADGKAQASYPWLKDQQSPQFQVALEIGRQIPGLLHSPEGLLHLSDAVRGRMAREAEEKKGTRPAPAKRASIAPPPNVTTAPSAAPRVTDPLQASVAKAEQEYQEKPTMANHQKLTHLRAQQKEARYRAAA